MPTPRKSYPYNQVLGLYVPAYGSAIGKRVERASAIVANPDDLRDGKLLAYFEGNVYGGNKDMESLLYRAMIARGRLLEHYPTTAMMTVEPADLMRVGDCDAHACYITDPGPLNAWAGQEIVTPKNDGEIDLEVLRHNIVNTRDYLASVRRSPAGLTMILRDQMGRALVFRFDQALCDAHPGDLPDNVLEMAHVTTTEVADLVTEDLVDLALGFRGEDARVLADRAYRLYSKADPHFKNAVRKGSKP